MPTLKLDHEQRLNLLALLGTLEGNIGETRAVWKLMDRLDLDESEKKAIGLTVQGVNGNEVVTWNLGSTLAVLDYELSEGEVSRIQRAIYAVPKLKAGRERRWLEPLLEQLPEPEPPAEIKKT